VHGTGISFNMPPLSDPGVALPGHIQRLPPVLPGPVHVQRGGSSCQLTSFCHVPLQDPGRQAFPLSDFVSEL